MCVSRSVQSFRLCGPPILLEKMGCYGFADDARLWLKSYLKDRTQKVCCGSEFSDSGQVSIGVPQGSILFSLYINDLPSIPLHCSIGMYADDTALYVSDRSLEVVERHLQSDLDHITTWMLSNKLKLNTKKCVTMLIGSHQRCRDQSLNITLLGHALNNVTTIKYLGVLIDNHLTWGPHLEEVKHRVLGKIACIKRLFPLPVHTTLLLYKAFVLPVLDYCDCVWSSASQSAMKSLFSIQSRFLLSLKNLSGNIQTTHLSILI